MPNSVKYNTESEANALRVGNMHIGTGDVPKGPTSTTGFYDAINPPNGGYTIYENKATQGPSICTPSSDAELISVTNQIAGASYTTINECFNYFASQNDKMVLANPINPMVTDELVLNIKAGILPSYPRNGSTFYDLSEKGNQFSLQNGPTFNSTGYLEFDGIDDRLYQGNVDLGLTNNAISFDIVIKPEGTSSAYRKFFEQSGDSSLLHPLAFRISDGFILSFIKTSGGDSNWYCGVPRYPDGTAALDGNDPKWLHLCLVADLNIDGETNRWLYLNGRLVLSKTQPLIGTLLNGTGSLYPTHNASGGVGSLQIYNKALSPSEILQNYYQAPIVTDGLVFAVDAGNLVSYESGSTTAYSLTGSNSGTLTNGVGFTSDKGGSWDFDGIDDRLHQGNVDLGLTNNAVSFDMWIKPEGTSGTYRRFFIQSGGDGLGNYPVAFRGSDGFMVSYLKTSGGDSNWYCGVPRYPDGTAALDGNNPKWLHLCVVADLNIDGETNRWIYLNGILIMTKTQPLIGTLLNGTGNLYPSYNANGGVGSLQIYNKALSSEEVQQNYNANINRFN